MQPRRLGALLAVVALLSFPAAVAAQQDGRTADVTARDVTFTPRDLTVPAGTTVTWSNRDPFGHTVTADDQSFNARLEPGETVQLAFTTPGEYPYYCIPHGFPGGAGMSGTIIVTADALQPAAPAGTPPTAGGRPAAAGLPVGEVGSALVAAGILLSLAGLAVTRRP